MAHQIEKMAFVGETPWHQLGTKLETPPATVADACVAGGVDWEIETLPMYLGGPAVTLGEPAQKRLGVQGSEQHLAGKLVDIRKAVVRKTDGSILGVVGADWTPIQNAQAFEPFQPFLDAGEVQVETVGSLDGGRRVWMLGKVARPDAVIVPSSDDRVGLYLLAAVGHDGSLSYTCGETGVRVVCNNTLRMALDGKNSFIKVRHTKGGAAAIAAVQEEIKKIDARFGAAADVFRALAGKEITSAAQVRRYIDAVFPAAKKVEAEKEVTLASLLARPVAARESMFSADSGDAVLTEERKRRIYGEVEVLFEKGRGNDMRGVKGTAWALYNGVTEYLSWERGASADRRMEHVWLGGAGPAASALPAAMEQFLGVARA